MREEKERILREVLRLLGEKYPNGLYEYLYKHRRELYNQLIHLEGSIDMAFLTGTIGELKAVLRDYWRLHIQMIKEYDKVDQRDLPMARQKMAEERIKA